MSGQPSHPPTRARRPKRAEVRDRLIRAAIAEFEQRGYHDTSIVSVAEAAGFSRGAAYSNFTSKEDLFLAALESNAAERIADLVDLIRPQDRPAPGASTVLTGLRRTERWSALFMEFCLQLDRRPELRDDVRDVRNRMRDQLAVRLAGALGSTASNDFIGLATTILAVHNGLVIESICDGALDTTHATMLTGLVNLLLPAEAHGPDRGHAGRRGHPRSTTR